MTDIRQFLLLLSTLALAGCSVSDASDELPASDENAISCAIGSASQFLRLCRVEREVVEGTLFLTIHHDDGGFRRLEVLTDGRGVAAADGADSAKIAVFDGEIEVAIGQDRYLIPAVIAGNGAQ